MFVRPARLEDCRAVWEWANDESDRAASFSPATIPWEAHVGWFERALSNPKLIFYIAYIAEAGIAGARTPIGAVRFERENNDEATISTGLAPEHRGQGLGREMIRLASEKALHEGALSAIHAYIKTSNSASVAAFVAAGYQRCGDVEISGQPALHLILRKLP